MKNFTLLFALGLILLTSCSKEDSLEQTDLQTINSVYVLNQINGSTSWDTTVLNETQRSPLHSNEFEAHTEGYYQPSSRNGMSITWTGTRYEDGTRKGSADLKQSSPGTNFHFILETECITVYVNEAVYGGTITQIKALSGNAPDITVGWRFYFKVIDSGQEENGPLDKIANTTFFTSPMSPSLCNVLLPTEFLWSSNGYSDVVQPGYVIAYNN